MKKTPDKGRAYYYRMRTPERRLRTHAIAAAAFAGVSVVGLITVMAYVFIMDSGTPAPDDSDLIETAAPRAPLPDRSTEDNGADRAPRVARAPANDANTGDLAVIKDCANCPEVVIVGSGRYVMGLRREDFEREKVPTMHAPSELPLHGITINQAFGLGKMEVTRGQFAAFVDDTGYDPSGCIVQDKDTGQWQDNPDRSWRNPGFDQSDDDPVVCVSWDDAVQYVQWLKGITGNDYRLPTETEWEYAARGGTNISRYWGIERAKACSYANIAGTELPESQPWRNKVALFECDDSFTHTAPVGSFEANAFLLYDMLGNVQEWVEDCWTANYRGAPIDGAPRTDGDCSKRVSRGGSWDDPAGSVRAARRVHQDLRTRKATLGFRVARDVTVDTGG